MPSKHHNTANGNSGAGQVSHRLRNFFRINTASNGNIAGDKDKENHLKDKTSAASHDDGTAAGHPTRPFRGRLFSSTVGRFRSHTTASEGNPLDEAMSPTAHANPYFAHQGMPGLRHHNAGSVPPSPPDTPTLKISGPDDGNGGQQATAETKEELARRLRRVASAPNTQGLFAKGGSKNAGERPATANLGKDPLIEDLQAPGSLSMVEAKAEAAKNQSLGIPSSEDTLSALPAPTTNLAFRRTYSSNSIKVRSVEVSPASFDKVKLIGKGDVGKVYLVREKKSNRLYAMKGNAESGPLNLPFISYSCR